MKGKGQGQGHGKGKAKAQAKAKAKTKAKHSWMAMAKAKARQWQRQRQTQRQGPRARPRAKAKDYAHITLHKCTAPRHPGAQSNVQEVITPTSPLTIVRPLATQGHAFAFACGLALPLSWTSPLKVAGKVEG